MRTSVRLLRPLRWVAPLVAVTLVGCIIVSSTTRGRDVPTSAPVVVASPVKAYLLDGSIVVYPTGATVADGRIDGSGTRYTPTLGQSARSAPIPLDSVIGVEAFERTVNPGRTLVFSAFTIGASAVVAAGLAVAVFGSCPTVYSDSAGTPVLEAESYSFSIAPLLEQRDVDRLRVVADASGIVRLEIRNEALETHYTDHLELLEVRHDSGELVLPAAGGGLVVVRDPVAPATMRDRAGRDLGDVLARADDRAFATDDAFLLAASRGGASRDHIDLVLPRTPGRDSVAVVIRMRSSLLGTVLLYDHMLARPGARALDWLTRDLGELSTLAELGTWYTGNFGLHVAVLQDGRYRHAVRVLSAGPAAWHDVAAVVPAFGDDSVRIRLSFLADEWRIDRVAVSSTVRTGEPRRLAPSRIVEASGRPRADVLDFVARADGRRLETRPGQRYFVEFDAGAGADASRTYLLGAQGYYIEWVRGSWLRTASDTSAFAPNPGVVGSVLREWRASRDSLERYFFERRVPTT
jgi:hypothetical protein